LEDGIDIPSWTLTTPISIFFTMSFDSLEQLEAAVNYMTRLSGRGAELHEKLWSQLKDYRFTCWED
jgi:hypothetical protein